MLRRLCWLLVLLSGHVAFAQYVTLTGTLQAANGLAAAGDTLAMQPTQIFFIAGTAVIVNSTVFCATSTDGAVVGTPNPLQGMVSSVTYSGTLPAGNYYMVFGWYDSAGHTTLTSPEQQVQLTGNGRINLSPPVSGMPATAVGMRIYIGSSPGTETLQGSTSGSATYVQSTPLVSGASVPTSNSTICQVVANDAGWPSNAGYKVTLSDPNGNTIPGYPMTWRFTGPNTAINLSNGLPLFNGVVTYPTPILSTPQNHNTQSISGALSLTNYNLFNVQKLGLGTAVPAWAVDAEGSDVNGAINANTGYLFNGAAPSNHVLLGNGSYYVDSATIPWSIISGAPSFTSYYQTVKANGSALPQRSFLNFGSTLAATDDGTNTNVNLPSIVGAGSCTLCNFSFDAYGRVTSASSTPGGTLTLGSGYQQLIPGMFIMTGSTGSFDTGPITITLPNGGFPTACSGAWAIDVTTAGRIFTAACASRTQLTIHNNGSTTGQWFAIGY